MRYDLGQATMSMMLAAADQGIGSAHAAVAEQDLARQLLGFPGDRLCAYLIAFGYPADRPRGRSATRTAAVRRGGAPGPLVTIRAKSPYFLAISRNSGSHRAWCPDS